jgi:hypothetical protein
MVSGDFNADGKTDLAVGAFITILLIPAVPISSTTAPSSPRTRGADIIITGEATSNQFGYSLASGDFNADGKTDLAVGAYIYSANTGRSYLFYNGSIITENAPLVPTSSSPAKRRVIISANPSHPEISMPMARLTSPSERMATVPIAGGVYVYLQ